MERFTSHSESFTSHSESETEALGERLGRRLSPDGVLRLLGEMGSGKTVLVRGVARALGIDPRAIQSPTYTLIHQHEGTRGRLVHVDLYRLEAEDLEAIGLEELLAGPGVKVIEWAERLPPELATGAELSLRGQDGEKRELELRGWYHRPLSLPEMEERS